MTADDTARTDGPTDTVKRAGTEVARAALVALRTGRPDDLQVVARARAEYRRIVREVSR